MWLLQFNEWRDVTLDEKTDEVLDIVFEIRSILANVSKKLNPTGNLNLKLKFI